MENDRTIWQISGGPASRAFADVFLRHGVGLIGSGDAGPWTADRDDEDFADNQGTAGGFVRRFASEPQVGDIVLLRTGLSRIQAVGLVASEYLYLNQFDDVNGWDLQHARRIRWCELPLEYDFGSPIFGANPMRFSRVGSEEVIDYVQELGVPLDIVVTDGVRYRMYSAALGYAPIAYANLIRLKCSALNLFNRIKRP